MSARVPRDMPAEVLAPYIVELPDPPRPLDLPGLFRQQGPLELEIGFGKGRFLVTAAELEPHKNLLGIEVRHVLRDFVASRLARRALTNARVMQGDAVTFMAHMVGDGCLDAIHFYFPDPWWKKRHHKRRIWTAPLFADLERALRPGGVLHLASDVPMVFEELCAQAEARPGLTRDDDATLAPPCTTNFEDKAARDARTVGRTAFLRA